MKIAILDTYYPEAIAAIPFDPSASYAANLKAVLDFKFGTSSFFSDNLRPLGHECVDHIANHHDLQWMWADENYSGQGRRNERILDLQIEKFQPDVVFMQDLSVPVSRRPHVLVGQCSCPWPGDEVIRKYDLIFTSFPHYVERIEALRVLAVYLPLAFEPSVLEGPQPERDIDISFVGGVGRDSHWRSGTDTLEAVAAAFPESFQWWGYGLERLPESSALRACYKGAAWGRDMYQIYRRSKIVINRHGEIALGFANNLRVYESVGCGAMLLTDNKTNLFAYGEIESYSTPKGAIEKLHFYLDDKAEGIDWRVEIAERGQRRALRDHTYARRMKVVSDTLQEMLYGSKAKLGRGTILMQGNGDTPERFFPIDKLEDAYRE